MRLIDADYIIKWYSETHGVSTYCLQNLIFLNELIKYMPGVDAVPVIRCKNCKYYKEYHSVVEKFGYNTESTNSNDIGYCTNYSVLKHEDDFCSRGEINEDRK